jgi:cytochrome P450
MPGGHRLNQSARSVDVEPVPPTESPVGARMMSDLVDVDLTTGATFRPGVPHDAFDVLRTAGGVAWHDEPPIDPAMNQSDIVHFVDSPGFWVVTSHELVSTVLRDPGTFSSHLGGTTMPTVAPDSLVMLRQMMLNMDPPEHVRLRRILQPVFTPRAVERLRDEIVVNAREIVDGIAGRDHCELVTAVSAEMPLRVLADLLGMPREDRHLLFEWSNKLLGFDAPDTAGNGDDAVQTPTSEEAIGAFAELMAYGQQIADARRAEPRDDVVSRIVHAEIDGERLDDTEFSMFWVLLVVAGNETTRNALSGAVVALHEHDLWGWLRDHPDKLSGAVDELLRYVSPVMQFRRTATTDTVLGDQQIRAGDKVVVWYGAANRDPEVFADPHHLDLERDPNPHLAFGVGPHFCLGAHLARLEIVAMLGELLDRVPDLQISGPVRRAASNFINGVTHLPVRLDYGN